MKMLIGNYRAFDCDVRAALKIIESGTSGVNCEHRISSMFFEGGLQTTIFPESFSERVLRPVRPGGVLQIFAARRFAESIVKMRHFVVSPSPLSSKMQKYSLKCNPLANFWPQNALARCFFDFFRDVLYGSLTFARFSVPSLPGSISGPDP